MRGCASAVGTTSGTGLETTPKETENTEADADGSELLCSEAAQQLSASACVTAREIESGESDLCIGHAAPSEQQAMRASGVASQPAHKATGLAESANVKTSAEKRLPELNILPKDAGTKQKCQPTTMTPSRSSTPGTDDTCRLSLGRGS
jgi:hypothetical protein